MVRTRSKYISIISTLLRRDGLRVRPGHAPAFLKRLAQVQLPAALREEVAPLVLLLQSLNEQIKAADERLAQLVKEDEVVARLCTAPGVGAVTATSFVSTLDDHARFAGAKEARAYLGLVPSEYSSGERQQRGHISKAGPGRARHMLVEAAWCILRRRNVANAELHKWAVGLAARRGSRVAVVALARKLAGILYAMWRDGTTPKTLRGKRGQVQIDVPRDRTSEFKPQLVKKNQTRFDGLDEKILSLYSRGMTQREIQGHLEEIYGVEVAPSLISTVTDQVKVKSQGRVSNKAIYLAFGVNLSGFEGSLGERA